jgi:DNA-binding NtrC family response regulator
MSPLILVVDDEPQIQILLELILKEKGYETSKCLNGEGAIKMMADLEFNLVILDLNLPGASGTDIANHIDEFHANTPIIFITGSENAETIALQNDCKRRDDRHFIFKPIMTDELYDSMNELIQFSLIKGKRIK